MSGPPPAFAQGGGARAGLVCGSDGPARPATQLRRDASRRQRCRATAGSRIPVDRTLRPVDAGCVFGTEQFYSTAAQVLPTLLVAIAVEGGLLTPERTDRRRG
ncbi:hypothetical protein GCM10023259_027980 [Thermocatellispora tengchongensis]